MGASKKSAYGSILTSSLRQFVLEQLEKPPESQCEIFEELALSRHATSNTVELYSKACERFEKLKADPAATKEEKGAAAAFKFNAAAMLQKELAQVTNVAQAAAKIQASQTNSLSLSAMEGIVNSVIDIIFESLRMEPNGLKIAARIEQKINSQINLSVDRGTVKLPSDELVGLMDNSIPRELESLDAE